MSVVTQFDTPWGPMALEERPQHLATATEAVLVSSTVESSYCDLDLRMPRKGDEHGVLLAWAIFLTRPRVHADTQWQRRANWQISREASDWAYTFMRMRYAHLLKD